MAEKLYPDDFLTDLPERFFVSEMVRERILKKTRDEIPYTTGVVIESFKEEGELVRIEATIVVERENQKGILIGKGGAMLKAIGTEARQDIEAFLGTKVYLGLFVKVTEELAREPVGAPGDGSGHGPRGGVKCSTRPSGLCRKQLGGRSCSSSIHENLSGSCL